MFHSRARDDLEYLSSSHSVCVNYSSTQDRPPGVCGDSVRVMDSGEFRVLDALAEATLSRTELVRRSGEPHSVLRALVKDEPGLFAESGDRFALSPVGTE